MRIQTVPQSEHALDLTCCFVPAHAIRLKLLLALQFSANQMDIEDVHEYDSYLRKLSHVSADCRLTIDEEKSIWMMSKSGPESLLDWTLLTPTHSVLC